MPAEPTAERGRRRRDARRWLPLPGLVAIGCAAVWMPPLPGVFAALFAILGLPAWGLGFLGGEDEPRLPGVPAGAIVGLGVACLTLWWTSLLVPLQRWTILVALAAVAVALRLLCANREREQRQVEVGGTGAREAVRRVAIASVLFGALVAVPFLVQGTQHGGAVRKVGMTDWYKHTVVTASLAAHEARPVVNPFVEGAPFAYYYGFHLVAAAAHELAPPGTSIFVSLLALTLVVAVCSPWVLYRFALRIGLEPRRAAIVAVAATLLAGFDVGILLLDTLRNLLHGGLPSLDFAGLRQLVPSTHLNYWIHHDERQFNPPYVATIWAPQHWSAALLALTGIAALAARRCVYSIRPVLVAVVCLAALPALSAYVALGTALAIGATVPLVFAGPFAEQRSDRRRLWVATGALAILAAAPALARLAAAGGQRLAVGVSAAGTLWHGGLFSSLLGDGTLARLLDTPLMLVLQLGVVGLLGMYGVVAAIRDREAPPSLRLLAPMPVVILVAVTLLRPPPGPNNLFARPMLVAWCLLVPYAVRSWERRRRGRGWTSLLLLCTVGVPYACVGATAEGYFFRASPGDLVAVSSWVRAGTPAEATVAIDPRRYRSDFGYWVERDFVLADERHAELFGASPEEFHRVESALRRAYDSASGAAAARELSALGADVALVGPDVDWRESDCFTAGPRFGDWQALLLRASECTDPGAAGGAR